MSDARPQRDVGAILRMRAHALAVPEVAERHDMRALAAFTVGGHALAVPLERVVRAAELRHLTEIPDAPPWILGLTTVEGHLVSLLDVAAFLGLPRSGVADVRGVLAVSSGGREMGLAAEQLLGISDVPDTALLPLPAATGALTRVAPARGKSGADLLLLDVDALFDDPRLGRDRG